MLALACLALLIRSPEGALVGRTGTLGLAGTEDSLLIWVMRVLITAGTTVYPPGTRIDTRYTHPTK